MSTDKRPPANLPPLQKGFGPRPAAKGKGGKKTDARKAYARAYAAGVLHAMAEKLHPAAMRRKKG